MLDQLREHGSEILSRADAGPVARTRCGQSSFTIVSPGKTACKSRFWPFSIQIVLASTMHYHADLEWVRTAFRNFSRTVVISPKRGRNQGSNCMPSCRCNITPIHEEERNVRRCTALVYERYPGSVAGCPGLYFLAEESLHSRELLRLCIGQGPQQLRFVRLPGKSAVLCLRAGRISSRDSKGDQKGTAIRRPD